MAVLNQSANEMPGIQNHALILLRQETEELTPPLHVCPLMPVQSLDDGGGRC